MKRVPFALVVAVGTLISPVAFAGQINSLGQWVPTSTEEGRSGWGQSSTTKQVVAKDARVTRQTSAGYIPADRKVRSRIDALGRTVPAQTDLP